MITLKKITKKFKSGSGTLEVLKGIDLHIEKGETISIIGRSGAGKSTLLHIMGTIDFPSEGEITISGKNISALKSNEIAEFRSNYIGFVFQFHHLLSEFTAVENVAMPAIIAGKTQKEAISAASEALEMVGLLRRLSHKPGELSGGEQQRVALARAFCMKPSIILCDEPTGNLDTQTGKDVFDILMNLSKTRQTTMIIVTHDNNIATQTDRIIKIEDGLVI